MPGQIGQAGLLTHDRSRNCKTRRIGSNGYLGLFQKIAEQIGKTFIGMTEVALHKMLMNAAISPRFGYCQNGFGAADITINKGFVQVSIDPELMNNVLENQNN